MSRWLPYPLHSALLFLIWLLLVGSVSPGHLLLAALLAWLLPWTLKKLSVPPSNMRRPIAFIKLFGIVVADIVRSNIAVARIILTPNIQKKADFTSGFIEIPLELKSHYALALLATIITSTPGTLWVDYDGRRKVMTLHVLDLVDEEGWVKLIKTRYERFLLEIFE